MADVVEQVDSPPTPHRRASSRLAAWRYALRTTNPLAGWIDPVSRRLVVTRAVLLPMTLFAGGAAALLAVRRPEDRR